MSIQQVFWCKIGVSKIKQESVIYIQAEKLPTIATAVSEVPHEEMFWSGVFCVFWWYTIKTPFFACPGRMFKLVANMPLLHWHIAIPHGCTNNADLCLNKYSPFRTDLENIWILLHIWKRLYTWHNFKIGCCAYTGFKQWTKRFFLYLKD